MRCTFRGLPKSPSSRRCLADSSPGAPGGGGFVRPRVVRVPWPGGAAQRSTAGGTAPFLTELVTEHRASSSLPHVIRAVHHMPRFGPMLQRNITHGRAARDLWQPSPRYTTPISEIFLEYAKQLLIPHSYHMWKSSCPSPNLEPHPTSQVPRVPHHQGVHNPHHAGTRHNRLTPDPAHRSSATHCSKSRVP